MASFFEQLVNNIHEELADPTLTPGVFRKALYERGPVRRVVWIPIGFRTVSVQSTNPQVGQDPTDIREVICQEEWDVECHITGNDFEDQENIREAILSAAREVLHTSNKPAGGRWATQDEREAETMLGDVEKTIQRFTWKVNILKPAKQTVVVERFETAAGAADPEADDAPELEQSVPTPDAPPLEPTDPTAPEP